ncbi:MAG: hypothetical protein JF616_03370 [Fibrobacteres bacterium]|nr:hypothetical protein [Fibrobacterota bacterium]
MKSMHQTSGFRTLVTLVSTLATTSFGLNTWQQVTADPLVSNLQRMRDLIFTANGDLYVAADTFQIYRSRDKGQNWENLRAGLPTGSVTANLGGHFGLNAKGEVLYSAGSSPGHVFHLVNNGSTWHDATHDQPWNHGDAVNGTDCNPAGEVLAIANGSQLFRSKDGGDSFSFVRAFNDTNTLAGRVHTNPVTGYLYLGLELQGYPGGNVQVSKDGGTSWSGLGGFDGNAAIWFDSAGEVFCSGVHGTFMRYSGSGTTWVNSNQGLPAYAVVRCSAVGPNKEMYLTVFRSGTPSVEDVYVSTDGGATWQVAGAGYPVNLAGEGNMVMGKDGYLYAVARGVGGVWRLQVSATTALTAPVLQPARETFRFHSQTGSILISIPMPQPGTLDAFDLEGKLVNRIANRELRH